MYKMCNKCGYFYDDADNSKCPQCGVENTDVSGMGEIPEEINCDTIMYCKNCGSAITNEDDFCPNCLFPIGENEVDNAVIDKFEEKLQNREPNENEHKCPNCGNIQSENIHRCLKCSEIINDETENEVEDIINNSITENTTDIDDLKYKNENICDEINHDPISENKIDDDFKTPNNSVEDSNNLSNYKKTAVIVLGIIFVLIIAIIITVATKPKYTINESSMVNISDNIEETMPIVDAVETDFEYFLDNNNLTITKYTGVDQFIRIPNTINGYNVQVIGEYAFNRNNNLINIIIPEGVKEIRYAAFADCMVLEHIEIPQSLIKIEDNAFCKCHSLKDIKIPKNVREIGELVFNGCSKLENIAVALENNYYSDVNGVLFSYDKTKLIKYPEGKIDNSYVIPNTVEEVSYFSFSNIIDLTNVELPDTVTTIAERAFDHCIGLKSITIPSNVSEIGEWAFCGTINLTNIIVDSNNENYCSVDNVLFNKSKTELIYYACNKPDENYVVPNSVDKIIHHAFQECNNLVNVTIPKNVYYVENGAFIDCANLSTIIFENISVEIDENMLGITGLGDGLNTTIVGYPNSSAELYAKEHSGIKFRTL